MGEKSETILLNVPAAKRESEDSERAEIIPLVCGRSLVVEMEVYGGPGYEMENIEIMELVPQIRLSFRHTNKRLELFSVS